MTPEEFIKKFFPELEKEKELIAKVSNNSNDIILLSTLINCLNYNCPEYLWHYTSIEALTGILKNKALWLFHYSGMNDPIEILHGKKLIQETILDIIKQKDTTHDTAKSLSSLQSIFQLTNSFLFSMIEQGDDLSFWRWYGNDGAGVSIKLSTVHFPFDLSRVMYEDDRIKDIIKACIDEFLEKNCDHFSTAIFLWKILPFIKSSSYSDENEWRYIIDHNHDNSKKTWIDNQSKSYTEYHFGSNSDCDGQKIPHLIKEIIIGPAAGDDAEKYIEELVKESGEDIIISRSPHQYKKRGALERNYNKRKIELLEMVREKNTK